MLPSCTSLTTYWGRLPIFCPWCWSLPPPPSSTFNNCFIQFFLPILPLKLKLGEEGQRRVSGSSPQKMDIGRSKEPSSIKHFPLILLLLLQEQLRPVVPQPPSHYGHLSFWPLRFLGFSCLKDAECSSLYIVKAFLYMHKMHRSLHINLVVFILLYLQQASNNPYLKGEWPLQIGDFSILLFRVGFRASNLWPTELTFLRRREIRNGGGQSVITLLPSSGEYTDWLRIGNHYMYGR